MRRTTSTPCLLARALLLLTVSLMLSACGTLSSFPVELDKEAGRRLADTKDLKAAVDVLADPLVEGRHTPGVVVGILTPDGARHFFAYGTADQATGRKPDEHTLFAVGSLSKVILADMAALLVQEHRLAWDDTLETMLPPGIPLSPDAKKITVLQLATHTSGLPRQPMTPRTLAYFVEYLFDGRSFYRHFDQQYLTDYLGSFVAPSKREPEYSNIGYGLLSYIVSLRTGTSLDTLLQEKMVGSLGLQATGYAPEQLDAGLLRARGYAGDQPKFIMRGKPVPDWRFNDVMRGSAALYSNASDLLSLAAAHLNGVADPKINAALQDTLQVRFDREKEAAALAWIVDDVNGRKFTYMVGLVAGYSSYIGLDRKNRTAVVVLQNSFNWSSIGHELLTRMADAQELGW